MPTHLSKNLHILILAFRKEGAFRQLKQWKNCWKLSDFCGGGAVFLATVCLAMDSLKFFMIAVVACIWLLFCCSRFSSRTLWVSLDSSIMHFLISAAFFWITSISISSLCLKRFSRCSITFLLIYEVIFTKLSCAIFSKAILVSCGVQASTCLAGGDNISTSKVNSVKGRL